MTRRPALQLKVTSFSVRTSKNQVARWGWWARQARARSIGIWLERLADAEVLRREHERGVYDAPTPPYAAIN